MTQKFKLENVEVSYSTMLNKPEKATYGRNFRVKVPIDSPVLEEMKKAYKELNEQAKTKFAEQVGKKLKNATSVDDVFAESIYAEGFVELNFNIFFRKDKEVIQEDGTTVKECVYLLNPIYSTPEIAYMIGNNGEKMYRTPNDKPIYPLSTNVVDMMVSLVAKYNTKENKPAIAFKAEDVKIVKSDFGKGSSGPKTGYITLDSDDEVVEKTVEKASTKKDDELFSTEDLATLDI